MQECTQILKMPWERAIQKMPHIAFDVVFLDPPYRMHCLEEICIKLADKNLLANKALLVLEHEKNYTPTLPEPFKMIDLRDYKETIIHLYLYEKEDAQ